MVWDLHKWSLCMWKPKVWTYNKSVFLCAFPKARGGEQVSCQQARVLSRLTKAQISMKHCLFKKKHWVIDGRMSFYSRATVVFLPMGSTLVLPSAKLLFSYQQWCSPPLIWSSVKLQWEAECRVPSTVHKNLKKIEGQTQTWQERNRMD